MGFDYWEVISNNSPGSEKYEKHINHKAFTLHTQEMDVMKLYIFFQNLKRLRLKTILMA